MIRVSVIVNTVDRIEDLKRCLQSILGQAFRDFEVVVVNNGLGAETNNFLREFLVKCSRRSDEVGIPMPDASVGIPYRSVGTEASGQRSNVNCRIVEDRTKKLSYLFNLGWKNTDPSSSYLAYLADDTEADPQYLSKAVEYLDAHSDTAAVSGPVLSTANPPGEMNYLFDLARKNLITKLFLKIYEYFVMENKLFEPGHWCQSGAFSLGAGIPQPKIDEPIEVDLLTSTSMVIRSSALEKVGGFDENFLFNHADGDLFIRLKKLGYKLVFHPLVKVLHHMRFGPTRYPEILGRDTAFYFLKDVRPKGLRGWIGMLLNILVFNSYFVFKSIQLRNFRYLKGLVGFARGVFDFFRTRSDQRNGLVGQLLIVTGFFVYLWLSQRRFWAYPGMLAFGDAYPFPNNFSEAFRFFFQSFDPRTPGGFNPQDGALVSSLIPLVSLLALFFGGNFILAQRFFYALPIPLSFLTMYFLVSRFTTSGLARLAAAFVYSANHFVVAEFAGGFTGNLYVQALLPVFLWQLKGLFEASQSGRPLLRKLLLFSGLLTFTYILSDHILLVLTPFWLLFVSLPLFSRASFLKRLKSSIRNFSILFISLLLVISLSLYHAYAYLKISLPYLFSKSLPDDVIPFFVTNVWDTYWQMSLGNVLRLGGSYFDDFFGGNDLWAKAGFMLPVAAFSWWLFPSNRQGGRLRLGFIFTLLAGLIGLLVYITGRGWTLPILTAFPVLFRFRNPSRLMLLLSFFYSGLMALTFDGLVQWAKRWSRRASQIFLAGVVLLSFIFSIYYFRGIFSGDYTLKQHRGDGFLVSSRYYSMAKFMEEEHQKFGLFRTAYFPWNHEETETKLLWLDPYTYGVPITYGAYVRNEYIDFMQHSFRLTANWKTYELGSLLAQGGVKYVVLNSQSNESGPLLYRFDYQTPWLLGSFAEIKKVVLRQKDLKFIKEVAGFEVYENTAFDLSRLDLKRAGFFRSDQEDAVRRLLIALTAVSWLGWLVLVLRRRPVIVGRLRPSS